MALLLICLLGLDFASKSYALQSIPPLMGWMYPFGGIPVFSLLGVTFSLNTVFNTGAAWGMFAGHSSLLFTIRAAIISGLILYLLFFPQKKSPKFPLWLIVTGAVGNAIDYWRFGHVIDFFHFTFWGHTFPIFNFADSYITIGVLSLFLFSYKKQIQICR